MNRNIQSERVIGASPKAGRREWIGLSVIALPCVLYSMDLTVLDLALPALSRALSPTSSELLWIVDSYGFLLAGSLITMGMLGDRVGRRRLLMVGAALFECGSIAAAFSRSASMLIIMRGLLGIAGATLAPSTLSLIRNMFLDARQRTFAIGIWTTSFSLGAVMGPLLGGLLLQRFWWGSAFLIGVPVMLLLLLLGPKLLPEFRSARPGQVDWPSAALSALGILPLIYGIKRAALVGFGVVSALAVLCGVLSCAILVRRQRTLREPLLDIDLFRSPAFSVALLSNVVSLFSTFGAFLFMAQYLQQVLGLSPMLAGLWTAPSALGFIVGSLLTPLLSRRLQSAHILALGFLVAALGLALLTRVQPSSPALLVVAACTGLALGVSPVVTLSTDLIIGSAPPERAGAAAAISETSTELGGALGIAILGSIGGAVYRSRMADVVGTGVPPRWAAAARDTLSGALAAAAELPVSVGRPLLDSAQQAFSDGMHVMAVIAAGSALGCATLALKLLPRAPRASKAR